MWRILILAVATSLAACARTPGPSVVTSANPAGEEQTLRAIIQRFPQVRDVDAEAALYAPDAWFFSTRTPEPLRGREARRADIAKRRAPTDGEVTVIEPERVVVAVAGDMAYDYGSFRTTWTENGQSREVHGYYLRAWRKIDGQWLSVAESVQRRP